MSRRISISSNRSAVGDNFFIEGKYANLQKTATAEYPPVQYFQLFRYSTLLDKFNISIATLFCFINAFCNVASMYTFGEVTGIIIDFVVKRTNQTDPVEIEKATEELTKGITWFVVTTSTLGFIVLVLTYLATLLFNYSALRQVYKIRQLFLKKILNQDIPWYDVHQTGDFSSRVADDLKKVEEGIGEKVSSFLFYIFSCILGIVMGLVFGWELALVCLTAFPATTISLGFISWISSKFAKQEMDAYGEAGAIAEETLSAIRTVVAFGGQNKEEERYTKKLQLAKINNTKRSLFNGISTALMWMFTYASYALSFWYGVKLIIREKDLPAEEVTYDSGNMVTIFFSILTATWSFDMAAPFIEIFGIAKGAASKIFAILESEPKINASKVVGHIADTFKGKIIFKDVHFSYPSRRDVKVLRGLNLTINPGETVALVGNSGCGKSTCIQLIQRYYDPTIGSITIDGNEMTDLNLTWLRSNIGVVGQEPVLFEATIAENIRMGNSQATQEDIEKAAKKANAHTFISALPQGYATLIGERGAQLSGGQKQRVAIARALVREPTILLLDEATSALDTNSEAAVQAALDEASNDYTTVIVAHRLSTVRNADKIVVIVDGQVVEEGKHNDLISKKGAYYQLITAQLADSAEENLVEDRKDSVNEQLQNTVTLESQKSLTEVTYNNVEETKEAIDNKSTRSPLWEIMKMNAPEWWLITIGCISSFVAGAGIPIYAIVFGDVLGVLSAENTEEIQNDTNMYAVYFLYIGIGTAIATLLQMHMLGVAGEILSMRLRTGMYRTILSQEIAWFDNKDNAVGALCARLSGEPASVQGATGQRIGTILNATSTVILALGICFYYDWHITLVSLCFSPLIIFSMYLEIKIVEKESAGNHESLQKSTKIAVEAISNIRTVASLGCEDLFQQAYMLQLLPYEKVAKKNTHFRGVVYGLSRSLMFFAYAAALYYGALLVKDNVVPYETVFIVSEALITSSWSLANAFAFTPNFQKGLISATRIFDLLNRVPKVRDGSEDSFEKWEKGNLSYDKVCFSYPMRPTVPVLKGLDLSVLQGKMVALVGPSGCGKSTVIQLLERFYDPDNGKVSSDGKNIKEMNLSALRSHLGIVSQEPNLFSRTIAENIAYGDNNRRVSRDEIIEAAKKANIHNFIAQLPLGYETKLGEKGTQLSGGQKQRIAIARALIRNPKVLLLDEATSALDAESEKVVQEALDQAKVGRTCISIAHRLTTIQDADVICVINQGRIAEMGTHSELLNLRGLYYNLYSLQHGAT